MTEPVIVKMAALLTPGDDDSSPHGSFDVLLSTQAIDRDGEALLASEWQLPLPEHIVFDIDHAMSVEKTIGSGRPFINEDGNLQVKGTYASTALGQTTRTLVNERHIRSTSVTFLRNETKDAEGKAVTRRELLNGAFVVVPANPEALVLMSKAVDAKASKAATMQAIHDLTAAGGAECKHLTTSPGTAVTDPEPKAAAPAPAVPSPADVAALIARARELAN